MALSLDAILHQADSEIRLPQSALDIMQMSHDPGTETPELIRAIERDPVFVARLLRLANSPTYSRGAAVTSIERAVMLLGFREVGQLAFALSAAKGFRKLENELLRVSSFWNHSLTTAVLARQRAEALGIDADGLFVAALLHDLGLLAQFCLCSEHMREALQVSLFDDDIDLLTAEQELLGFTHPELGALICRQWRLPPVIIDPVQYHHAPGNSTEHREAVAVVAWANVVETLGTDTDRDDELTETLERSLLPANDVVPMELPVNDDALAAAQATVADMLALF